MKPTSLGTSRLLLSAVAWLALAGSLSAQSFDYPDFSSVADLALQGRAAPTADRVRLTDALPGQAGGLWHDPRVFVSGGFETTFRFQISGGAGARGEGFALVIQDNAVPALGPAGDGLGYDGVPNSLAIEFDTRESAAQSDPLSPHISIHTRQSDPNRANHSASLGAVTNGLPDFADGNVHTGRVVYAGNTLEVFLDDLANPVLGVVLPPGEYGEVGSIEGLLGLDAGLAWLGFTASTGEGFGSHDLLSWSFAPLPSPLMVSLISPADGASFLTPATILLEAAVVSTGTVLRVEFFRGADKLGEATAEPWRFLWKDVLPGAYKVTAVATEDSGHRSAAAPIRLKVFPVVPPIGLNFATGTNDGSYPLALAEEAGVVAQRVWNNLASPPNGNGSAYNLKNGGGALTTLDVTWDFAATGEEPVINAALSGNHRLMKAHGLDAAGTGGGQTNSTITVSQIPFAIYDVLVYSDAANGAADRVAEFRLGSESRFLRDASWTSFSGAFAEAGGAADLGAATPAGNYVRFNSLTNSSFTLILTARSSSDGVRQAAVNGLQIVASVNAAPPRLTRGPYLQVPTPTGVTVRWRTSRATDSRVRYGLSPGNLTLTNENEAFTTEHIVTLTDLKPSTRYYYAVGSTETNLYGGSDCSFWTYPTSAAPARIFFISDYGFKDAAERSVRDAYSNYLAQTEGRPADVWLSGGDNDQTDGRDSNYQLAVFGTDFGYGELLRRLPLWPTIGNHDYQTAQGQAYYANFTLPTNGEAGGVPSGTEQYYSFNYGDVHFVCLDSIDGTLSRSADTPMTRWLHQDLASATQRWVIAYWHGAVYSKGSHDSDSTTDTLAWMVQMRENLLPILESYGVDLVLYGHSHVYERTWLLQGHYGFSQTFSETNKLDGGNGRATGTGPYLKTARGPGTVYVTAAVGGQLQNRMSEKHPAHLLKIADALGFLLIDVGGNQLDLQFIDTDIRVLDSFTISKAPPDGPPSAPTNLQLTQLGSNRVQLTWTDTANNEMRFILERSASGGEFIPVAVIGANLTNFTDLNPPLGVPCAYRLRAWSTAGESPASNLAETVLVQPLRILSLRRSAGAVELTWYSEPEKTYTIERTPSLSPPDWQPVENGISTTTYTTTRAIPDDGTGPTVFYRVWASDN